eukprot:scaffold53011_cov36-Tisochrysis_lutea.AAC.4
MNIHTLQQHEKQRMRMESTRRAISSHRSEHHALYSGSGGQKITRSSGSVLSARSMRSRRCGRNIEHIRVAFAPIN